MAKKKKEQNEMGTERILKETMESYLNYLKLSRMLFANPETSIYDINELKEGDMFYMEAKGIADDLGVNWENMSHADSNRIMLALLEDFYQKMKKTEKGCTIGINFKLNDDGSPEN